MISYFLAAGASHPFGYPVTREFHKILLEEMVTRFRNNVNSVSGPEKTLIAILKNDTYVDIEYVFEFLKQLLKIKQSYPFVVDFFKSHPMSGLVRGVPTEAYEQGIELNTLLESAEYFMNFVTERIYQYYSWRKHNIEKIQQIYSKLLHLVSQNQTDIYTTNYDTVIEEYSKESTTDYNLIDGFEYNPKIRTQVWNPSLFDQVEGQTNTLHLFKIHGSLNWKQHRKHGIVKLEDIEKPMVKDGQYEDDLLIKPTLSPKEEEKDEPFKTLFDKFKERIVKSSACLIIGYSFRDQGINEILDFFIKQGGKLIVISPDATDEFTKNFTDRYHPDESSYSLLDEKVTVDGIDPLVEKLKSHIQ